MSESNYTRKHLAELFAFDLRQQEFDVCSVGELVHFTYRGEDFYAFLRAISYAGNPHPKSRFRAQMPKRPYLDTYKDNGGVFLFVGYDQTRDVYALWNPYTIRPRINQKDTVSLFCDEDALNSANDEGICWTKLPNGGLYVVFEIEKFSEVLDNLTYFQDEMAVPVQSEMYVDVVSFISSMIKDESSTLEIIEACMNNFANEFPNLDYLAWRTIIKSQKAAIEQETNEVAAKLVEERANVIEYAAKPIADEAAKPVEQNVDSHTEKDIHEAHEDFWSAFIRYNKEHNGIYASSGVTLHDWLGKRVLGIKGVSVNVIVGKKACRSEIYINAGSKDENKRIFDFYYAFRNEIVPQIPELVWQRLDDKDTCRVRIDKPLSFLKPENRVAIFDFFVTSTNQIVKVFAPYGSRYGKEDITPEAQPKESQEVQQEEQSGWGRIKNLFRRK